MFIRQHPVKRNDLTSEIKLLLEDITFQRAALVSARGVNFTTWIQPDSVAPDPSASLNFLDGPL